MRLSIMEQQRIKRHPSGFTRRIYIPLIIDSRRPHYYLAMPQEPLVIEDIPGPKDGQRVLRLSGPLVITTLFQFQAKVRASSSPTLIIDFTNVPCVDSAGIGALVGAYVTHQKEGRSLYLVGVSDRIHNALQVTRVDNFFRFFGTMAEAENAI
jgi:anti-sigma B factor antagonist